MGSIPSGLSQGPGSETPNVAHLVKSYQTALGKVQQQKGSPIENMFLRVVKGNVEFVAREAGWKGRLQNFLARHNFGSYNVQRIAKALESLATAASGTIPQQAVQVALVVSSIFDRLHPCSNSMRVQSAVQQIRSTVLQAAGTTEGQLQIDIWYEFKGCARALGVSDQDLTSIYSQSNTGESLSLLKTRLLEGLVKNLVERVKGDENSLQALLDPKKVSVLRPNSGNTLAKDLYQAIMARRQSTGQK